MRKKRKEGAWPLMSEPSRENVTERLQWMLEKAAKILSKPYPKFTKEEGAKQASDYISDGG